MNCNSPLEETCQTCTAKLKHRLYCNSCETLQQLGEGDDYFAIFGHPRVFLLDKQLIEQHFDELILALHPDFYATAEPVEQALSVEHTALLHEAKEALYNPYLRGRYLLTLLVPGIASTIIQPPQNFILETFEVLEDLDKAEQGQSELQPIINGLQTQFLSLETKLQSEFQQLESSPDQPELVESIQVSLAELKFLLNLLERASHIEKNK